MEQQNQTTRTVMVKQKSMGLAILLAFLFGPLGMLYATIPGAIVMFILDVLMFFFTGGLGLIITIPVGIIWAAMAVSKYNKEQAMKTQV